MTDLIGFSWPGGSPESTGLIIALIAVTYLAILWFSAMIWAARDISQRSSDRVTQLLFTLIVVVFNFPGLVIYRVLRPPLTLQEAEEHELESSALRRELAAARECPNASCGHLIGADYLVCPACGIGVRMLCNGCERALDAHWRICPWCATIVSPPANDQNGNAPSTPAARQREPAASSSGSGEQMRG